MRGYDPWLDVRDLSSQPPRNYRGGGGGGAGLGFRVEGLGFRV